MAIPVSHSILTFSVLVEEVVQLVLQLGPRSDFGFAPVNFNSLLRVS